MFDHAPQRIYWEITRACDLACRHCRAEASPVGAEGELSPEEGLALLDRLAAFGPPAPHVILTGGDPLKRRDLWDLIARARTLGMGVAVSPSATPLLVPAVLHRLKDAGVEAISLSVDAPTATDHDALRGVPGCFERTLEAAAAAKEAALPVQINTLVSAETLAALPAVYALACALGAARWSLFFLVSVGRGTVLSPIDADQCDRLFEWLVGLPAGPRGGPIVTTTEAPHYRRVVLQHRPPAAEGPRPAAASGHGAGMRDGNGVMFISSEGDVYPSGFLPVPAGNVRTEDPIALYRDSKLFQSLRAPATFAGRCGACNFHSVCGGSRARAFSASGSPLGEDPLCSYTPPATS